MAEFREDHCCRTGNDDDGLELTKGFTFVAESAFVFENFGNQGFYGFGFTFLESLDVTAIFMLLWISRAVRFLFR